MSYSRNFGFRSTANVVRDGRCVVPSNGTAFKIGAPVLLDPANPGKLKAATAGAATVGGGLVVFEHVINRGTDPSLAGTAEFDYVPLGAYAQRVHGNGVKVWMKNTASKTLYDGRTIAAATPLGSINLGSLAIGAQLTPDGSGQWKVANGTTDRKSVV